MAALEILNGDIRLAHYFKIYLDLLALFYDSGLVELKLLSFAVVGQVQSYTYLPSEIRLAHYFKMYLDLLALFYDSGLIELKLLSFAVVGQVQSYIYLPSVAIGLV